MQKSLTKWWSSGCQIKLLLDSGLSGWTKLYLGLLGFIEKLFGSGWPKWPRVGSNLGSDFGPTHPYRQDINSFFIE